MAKWALGASLAFCVPLGFVIAIGLAIAVLVKGRDGRDHGHGMAVAALIISALLGPLNALVVVMTLLGGWEDMLRDDDGRIVEAGALPVDRLRVGDCISGFAPQAAQSFQPLSGELMVVPCGEPHRAEVFAINPIDQGDYADQVSLDDAASRGCHRDFEEYVGLPPEESVHEIVFYAPGIGQVTPPGDVVCVVDNRDGVSEEMLEESRR